MRYSSIDELYTGGPPLPGGGFTTWTPAVPEMSIVFAMTIVHPMAVSGLPAKLMCCDGKYSTPTNEESSLPRASLLPGLLLGVVRGV